MVGYGGAVFSFRNQYWLWCPVIAPVLGALVGTFIYDLFFFTGGESIINRRNAQARRAHQRARDEQREKPIAGADAV
ncbi:hypothetical protein NM688_g1388 [Phlebia brevispora]|uniref:Uncharacterized protein n=1 Tax=Phlebia brevispora TaxID=194682 RepID=A0ACC1TBL5_9APHY|nr:hypothetical protein NM688_g1388 [Phlebia brevispora]